MSYDDHDRCRRCGARDDGHSLAPKAASSAALLGGLLAVIHRDGGHYTLQHGVERSCGDAVHRVLADRGELALSERERERGAAERALREAAEAEVARLQREVADIDAHNERASDDYLARFGHDANCGGPDECGCMVAELARGCMAEVVREVARLRLIVDAARAHVAELATLVAAEADHSGPQPTAAARHGAMAAVLVARRGVVGTTAGLAGACEG